MQGGRVVRRGCILHGPRARLGTDGRRWRQETCWAPRIAHCGDPLHALFGRHGGFTTYHQQKASERSFARSSAGASRSALSQGCWQYCVRCSASPVGPKQQLSRRARFKRARWQQACWVPVVAPWGDPFYTIVGRDGGISSWQRHRRRAWEAAPGSRSSLSQGFWQRSKALPVRP